MPFRFGDFGFVCHRVALPLCTALRLDDPECYSRNIDLGRFLMFEPCTCFFNALAVVVIDIVAIFMTCIMIYNIKSKYTAVGMSPSYVSLGRKEIVIFFYLYFLDVVFELLLVSNILPFSSPVYPVRLALIFKIFAAAQIGTITGTFFVLLMNGFVGFQLAEDGTTKSVWVAALLCFSRLGRSLSWHLLQASLLHCLPFSVLLAFPTKRPCLFLCCCLSLTRSLCWYTLACR